MGFVRTLTHILHSSLVGIAGMLYTTVAMAIRYFGGTYALPSGKFLDAVMTLPVFGTKGANSVLDPKALILMCMLSNAYIAHFNAPKFFYELKDRTLGRFNQVVGWSFGASVILYSIISGLGFLTFGASSNGLILNNYSTKDVLMGFSRVAVALSVIGRYNTGRNVLSLCTANNHVSLLTHFLSYQLSAHFCGSPRWNVRFLQGFVGKTYHGDTQQGDSGSHGCCDLVGIQIDGFGSRGVGRRCHVRNGARLCLSDNHVYASDETERYQDGRNKGGWSDCHHGCHYGSDWYDHGSQGSGSVKRDGVLSKEELNIQLHRPSAFAKERYIY